MDQDLKSKPSVGAPVSVDDHSTHIVLPELGERHLPRRHCAFCELPLEGDRPPVSLKTGQRVHLECYVVMRATPKGQPN